ncbi:hypothetical protein X801_05814 [Opisthorchis viverrini]|uniref:WGR domain-containing protein n=1 Tax=Opisthorchis viverrini TaxID=6198 RepID=A0A1S8WVR1_OPIVI|nr:hypothetical protein X801_05814 [Opisthorchis viverrini]
MPPKRKVTSAVKTSVKQAKTDDDTDEKLTLKKKLSALKKVEDKKTHKVDKNFCVAGGETGQSATLGPFDQLGQAITSFEKKFTDKTANKWDERMNFKFRPGKYSIVDVVDASEPDDVPVIQQTSVNDELSGAHYMKPRKDLFGGYSAPKLLNMPCVR